MSRADGRVARRALAAMLSLSACSGGTSTPAAAPVPVTVAIGGLPGRLTGTTEPPSPPTSAVTTTTTEAPREPIEGPIVDAVLGHRLLLIGDTTLSMTTPRAGGTMCDFATALGWDVEIEAERGRFISFADEVLDEVSDEWDVVGLMFGHHIEVTVEGFERTLDDLLERLSPRPVILYTVAETGQDQVAVNEALRDRQRSWPNVVVVDWAAAASAEPDVLLEDGGPFPTDEGVGRLALFTGAVLGDVPGDAQGTCVPAVFTDDSAIVL